MSRTIRISLLSALCLLLASTAEAQYREFAPVPPSLEIEVLDPGADPESNPAIELTADGKVNIPPVVLVHRYYYSGDRSFQGPMLPGGSTILVLNHPNTGEVIYVNAQMMPGAPRVTYTKKGITFQYKKHATMLRFDRRGTPFIKYRSGLSVPQRIGKVLHTKKIGEQLKKTTAKTKRIAQRTKTTALGVQADLVDAAKIVTLPAENILRALPIGNQIFTGEAEAYYAKKAAKYKREREIRHAEIRKNIDDLDITTNR